MAWGLGPARLGVSFSEALGMRGAFDLPVLTKIKPRRNALKAKSYISHPSSARAVNPQNSKKVA